MEHLVIEDQFHGVRWDLRMIQAAVHHDLIERRIEAAEHGTPGARTPCETWPVEKTAEILAIDCLEHGAEVMRGSIRAVRQATRPILANARDVLSRGVRQRELAIDVPNLAREAASVQLCQQNRSRCFDDRQRSLDKNIR